MLLSMLGDDILMLCLGFLASDDLAACIRASRRLHTLAVSDELWQPLVEWLPSLGFATASHDICCHWRAVWAHWLCMFDVRCARAGCIELREREKVRFNQARYHSVRLRRTVQAVQAARSAHAETEQARQALLAARALSGMEDVEQAHRRDWGLTRPRSPPSETAMASAHAAVETASTALREADRQAAISKQAMQLLESERVKLERQRVVATSRFERASATADRLMLVQPQHEPQEPKDHTWPTTHLEYLQIVSCVGAAMMQDAWWVGVDGR